MRCVSLLTALVFSLAATVATLAQSSEREDPKAGSAVAQAVAPSFVRVLYEMRFDKGDAPRTLSALTFGTPGRDALTPYSGRNWDYLIREERPFQVSGLLISPTQVLTADLCIDPRFVKSIRVQAGGKTVDASIASYALNQDAVLLTLAAPLDAAKPIKFVPGSKEPLFVVRYQQAGADWLMQAVPFSGATVLTSTGSMYTGLAGEALFVDAKGQAVGARFEPRLPVDETWRADPASWKWVSKADLEKGLGETMTLADESILRVKLDFRSPKSDPSAAMRRETELTEWHGVAVVVDPNTVLVLANLKAKATARLDRIRLYKPSGEEVLATFKGSLKDYCAFIATTTTPFSQPVKLSSTPITDYRTQLLRAAEVTVQGENRTAYRGHTRLYSFVLGNKDRVYPSAFEDFPPFLFDDKGTLVALPLEIRYKVTAESEYDYHSSIEPTGTELIRDLILGGKTEAFDSGNVPLSEDEENRLAWIGVELQPLDQDLARINKVSDQTSDGESGAIVTFVYPDSPAAKNGIQAGDILLRLHADGQPKPLDIRLDTERYSFMENFPWDRLDEIPAEVYDRIPTPWGAAENSFTRALTDLGAGTKYTADIASGGVLKSVPMEVEYGPAHYNSVKRFKHDASGITARDLTYETRRYFQFTDKDPGVVVSKVEAGSKAGVAGLRLFEIITHVNDQPVNSVADLEKLLNAGGEIRLNVKRMTQGRIVKFNLDPGAPPPAPSTPDAASPK